ncbi:MAG: adenylate/guanylate cyclase domain-containing protein [Nevskiales bacterium]
MTLVERFIEFNSWSTARKTVLLMAVAVPMHVVGSLLTYGIAAGLPEVVRIVWIGYVLAAGIAIVAVLLLFAWIETRRNREGRWLLVPLIVLYSGWIIVLVTGLGAWSSPVLAWPLMLIPFLTVWYGERVGLLVMGVLLISFCAVPAMTMSGVLPYAWLLTARTLDAQVSWRFFFLFAVVVGFFFFYAFVLEFLAVAARKLQDQRLNEAHEKLTKSSQLIRRYVPSQIADRILSGQQEVGDAHERRKLTIFFSDLVGFSEIAEELEPEDLSKVLNEYFSEMTAIAQKHGGTVDELSGDAILIFFGAPVATDDKDHALRAVRMATEMQQVMAGLNAKWRAAGITEALQVRMGINTGVVTIGNFGSPDRMKYAALGKHVNLAAACRPSASRAGSC